MKPISHFILFALVALLITSCNIKQRDAEIAHLKAITDSLTQVETQKTEAINGFVDDFIAIQDNIALIKKKEGMIDKMVTSGVENKPDAREQIIQDMRDIYQLLQENKKKLSEMRQRESTTSKESDALNRMVLSLQNDLKQKTVEITALRQELAKYRLEISGLESVIDQLDRELDYQNEVIAAQDVVLREAWYRIATRKDLKAEQVIDNKGKVIFSGDEANAYFVRADKKKTTAIPVFTKKANLVSFHPEGSYLLCGEKKWVDSIQIIDKTAFWSVSNYCIIEVKY